MHTLSIDDLHALRLAIFDNAEALHREADLLLKHGMYSRAYLLAHLCFEELGKIPIVVGAIGKLTTGEAVDWIEVKKRFSNHKAKIESQNRHFYVFGLEVDLISDTDIRWLREANAAVSESYSKKNLATYVDASGDKILRPSEAITEDATTKLVQLAFECLSAHWRSEGLTNPLLYKAESEGLSGNDA